MITIPLSQLLARGVRLDAAEAIAIVQALTSSRGIPVVDNVEIDSAGGARCISTTGEPTVATLASLLDRLLPAVGIPAALRYTVARGTGAVEAPPFPSIGDFSRALARFEPSDRADAIRGLLSRGRPAPPPIEVAPPPNAVAPYGPSRLRRATLTAFSVAAALFVSAVAGYVGVDLIPASRSNGSSTPSPLPAPARALRPPVSSGSVTAPAAEPTAASRAPSPVMPRVDRVRRSDAAATPVRALRPIETNAFSPAFSSAGTALFFQTGGAHDSSSAIAMARLDSGPSADLRIMKILDDGARNYHAHPSPDGRTIAFDSDRDGERAVYLANSDGTHVRRISPAGYSALPSWSPDGSRLAYVRAEPGAPAVWNIWVQPIDGRAPQRVTHYRYGQTWAASWFPDGRRIAYSHEDELTILDLGTLGAEHFASPVPGRLVRTPAVSPDGSRIVFQVFRAGVWMLNVRDGSMECVLADPTAEEFAWAPDGRRFAFHSRRDGEWGVYVISASSAS